eukprot:CAMPEP_0198286000 /NCGR_PEP_ID=MMETSP1449-20131203/5191_1 /TAXON_ID=420275 /ORGANISM="Attheya septentrionalis, Strain CCMP2084" /LENGTH=541 /DNA_ID=CAMNT_0043983619 /DNA_START=67 /DNA_END=1692 /DNA_ORIENTATION=+
MPPEDNNTKMPPVEPTHENGGAALAPSTGSPVVVDNFIGGKFVPAKEYMDVTAPTCGKVIGRVAVSSRDDVEEAVAAAAKAFPSWSKMTTKARASVMLRFHALVEAHAQELAELIVLENGKNVTEALADVAKGNETVEYACSLSHHLGGGSVSKVSSQVTCQDRRDPLGIVASIVPFNFPFMVPMWTVPISLVMGNVMILKPSEKVPLTMHRVASLFRQAGLPDGVFNMIQGTRTAVESIIDHPQVKAVTFVGSSPVAKLVAERCRSLNKRVTALGGAKNHLVALPDCDVQGAASDIMVSYAGCAGQRCMAASVLLLVGSNETNDLLVEKICENASQIHPGTGPGQLGPVIDKASYNKIISYIQDSEQSGTKVLLDGRSWANREAGGYWIGPTILLHTNPEDRALHDEIFGPVLSILKVSSWAEAIAIENANPFGNAACIYTSQGGHADWFTSRFRASMLGVNIGIPVPREPFSFGGLYGTQSKYGDMDITGDGAVEFFTNRIKITTKWPRPTVPECAAEASAATAHNMAYSDHANFSGRM